MPLKQMWYVAMDLEDNFVSDAVPVETFDNPAVGCDNVALNITTRPTIP